MPIESCHHAVVIVGMNNRFPGFDRPGELARRVAQQRVNRAKPLQFAGHDVPFPNQITGALRREAKPLFGDAQRVFRAFALFQFALGALKQSAIFQDEALFVKGFFQCHEQFINIQRLDEIVVRAGCQYLDRALQRRVSGDNQRFQIGAQGLELRE
jgi:hypothetical protein